MHMDNRQNFQPNIITPPTGGEVPTRTSDKNSLNPALIESHPTPSGEKSQLPSLDFSAINFTDQTSHPIAQTPASTAVSSVTPITVDDTIIPDEWIIKAKKIIEATRTDPRSQNNEINKLKAEYLKRRFNIDLKIPNDD